MEDYIHISLLKYRYSHWEYGKGTNGMYIDKLFRMAVTLSTVHTYSSPPAFKPECQIE